jgi:hypothetical protein
MVNSSTAQTIYILTDLSTQTASHSPSHTTYGTSTEPIVCATLPNLLVYYQYSLSLVLLALIGYKVHTK